MTPQVNCTTTPNVRLFISMDDEGKCTIKKQIWQDLVNEGKANERHYEFRVRVHAQNCPLCAVLVRKWDGEKIE